MSFPDLDFYLSRESVHDTPETKILELYQNIKFLQEEINQRILTPLPQCQKSCQDLNQVLGDLNDRVKKSKR